MEKKRFFRQSVLISLILMFTVILVACSKKAIEPTLVYSHNQVGLILSNDVSTIEVNDQNLDLYPTISKPIKIMFQSLNLDKNYHNIIEVNGVELPLKPLFDTQNEFIDNSLIIMGPNVIEGTLTLKIKSGTNRYGTYDTFSLRNIKINIDGKVFWSNEYSEENFFNTPLKFGNDLKTQYRFGYLSERELTFTIPNELLDVKGTIFNEPESQYVIKQNKNSKTLINPYYVDFDVNVFEGETISETKSLSINKSEFTDILVYLDGFEIREDFIFTKEAWSIGSHELLIIGSNNYGFDRVEEIEFTLSEYETDDSTLAYITYDPGVDATLTNDLPLSFGKIVVPEDYDTKFSKNGVLYLEVSVNEDKTIEWVGNSILGRSVIMQAYNQNTGMFETVSTDVFQEDSDEMLAFNYSVYGDDFITDNQKVILRIASTNNHDITIDQEIIHFTDMQYMTRYAASTGQIAQDGKDAFQSVFDYMEKEYEAGKLLYTIHSGDFVQTMTNQALEWQAINNAYFNQLFESNIPFGTSSGNHDVGGTSDNPNSYDGGNTLDDKLIYTYYSEHLGDDKFTQKPWFGGSFMNGRSHYDLVNINNQDFVFLYLGWGSSIPGIHVSGLDISYARTVLNQYPDKIVVLITHDYLGNKGNRTATGIYVYDQLVSRYSNIRMVLSGHVNGTSARIDAIDDDSDGIKDREVIQILTDLQEEENLFGASWIRKIGLDYENNKMHFQLYSPYMNDYDVYVNGNPDYVLEYRNFEFDFNLSNQPYVMTTKVVK